MKKRISVFTAFCIQLIFMTLPLPVASAKSVNYSLFDKFLKYDLCITDYNALTEKEKELCHCCFYSNCRCGLVFIVILHKIALSKPAICSKRVSFM